MNDSSINEIEPLTLKKVRDWVRQNVPGVTEARDRRGYPLLHWSPTRPNDSNKPGELSLEHEARLLPASQQALHLLLENLHLSEDRHVGEKLLPKNTEFGELTVHRYQRAVGPQSVDRYYDRPNFSGDALTPRMITLRERIMVSNFMTWNLATENMKPWNLELPFISLGNSGLTARLEFNWVDDFAACLSEATLTDADDNLQLRNPLFIATKVERFPLVELKAVLEHTTFREKFGFRLNSEEEAFVLNVDHVTAQSLESGRIGSYNDVDIAGVKDVNLVNLAEVKAFAQSIMEHYDLQPNLATKAWRDAKVTGLL